VKTSKQLLPTQCTQPNSTTFLATLLQKQGTYANVFVKENLMEKTVWCKIRRKKTFLNFLVVFNNIGKSIPVQAWRGPEDSRRLWVPDFKKISLLKRSGR